MPVIKNAIADFDNLEDVRGKFNNTVCYYDNVPCYVKGANYTLNDHGGRDLKKFTLTIVPGLGGRTKYIDVHDPLFTYRAFNIGYVNTYGRAFWMFRQAKRQWQQGLKRDQLGWLHSMGYAMPEEQFGFIKPYTDMLSNIYPSMQMTERMIRNGDVTTMAFHKDFALSWDELHQDFILECKGKKIGVSLNRQLKEFKLLPEFNHLAETIQEVLA